MHVFHHAELVSELRDLCFQRLECTVVAHRSRSPVGSDVALDHHATLPQALPSIVFVAGWSRCGLDTTRLYLNEYHDLAFCAR